MNAIPRQKLCQLVARYGTKIWDLATGQLRHTLTIREPVYDLEPSWKIIAYPSR